MDIAGGNLGYKVNNLYQEGDFLYPGIQAHVMLTSVLVWLATIRDNIGEPWLRVPNSQCIKLMVI